MSLHTVCAFLLHLRRCVGVGVQRKGGRVVSEVALYRLDVIACPDGCDGVGMAQIVESSIRQASGFHQLLIARADGLVTEVLADLIGEHKTGNIALIPCAASKQARLILMAALFPENLHDVRRGRDNALFVIFQRRKVIAPALERLKSSLLYSIVTLHNF